MLKVIVICDVDSQRGQSAIRHLQELNVNYVVCPAIFPSGSPPWSMHYNEAKRFKVAGYPMVRGEVGCFLSHREAWKTVVAGEDNSALIIEDDAIIDPNNLATIDSIAHQEEIKEVITLLFTVSNLRFRRWKTMDHVSVVLPSKTTYSTVAYIVTKKTARKLLAASESFFSPVDNFLNMQHLHGVPLVHTYPFLVSHNEETPSCIGVRNKPRISSLMRLIRNYYKFTRLICDRVFHLRARIAMGLVFRKLETPESNLNK